MKIERLNTRIPFVPNLSRLDAEPRRAGFDPPAGGLFIKTPLKMVLRSL